MPNLVLTSFYFATASGLNKDTGVSSLSAFMCLTHTIGGINVTHPEENYIELYIYLVRKAWSDTKAATIEHSQLCPKCR